MRLLCDEMLHGLARWLRAAGHDTAVADGGIADAVLVRRAAEEGRLLLTRDRRLAARADAERVPAYLPEAADLDRLARELRHKVGIDWQAAPFTRCLLDNAMLVRAGAAEIERVPAASRPLAGQLTTCPACRRLYWPGSHFRRMERRLALWAAEAAAAEG